MASNQDAAQLDADKKNVDRYAMNVDANYTRNIPQPSPPQPGRSFSGADSDDAAPHAELLSTKSSRGRGCAGCASGPGGEASLLMLGLVFLFVRRRRRA
jgi:MYXO-CTERM domain-containing protein